MRKLYGFQSTALAILAGAANFVFAPRGGAPAGKKWTTRTPRHVPDTLPASFYKERAQAKRERKAVKLIAMSRHWPQQRETQ
ncbi:MAG TPA: hypothetical protein GXX48_11295 [Ochrobactrum intermedium]|uniref:Secreted protein n=1 Tax=Brucella intermedia TaxID=94625 RepID=A0A7V6TZS7_9HYPH|nr:hypothetical protein [Brucella intermedia]HHV68213.1 hypothetical protein [Brucella intermedia]